MESLSKDTLTEELVETDTRVVRFLINEGLPCVICGQPYWGSLGQLAREKGWSEERIDLLVEKLRAEMATWD